MEGITALANGRVYSIGLIIKKIMPEDIPPRKDIGSQDLGSFSLKSDPVSIKPTVGDGIGATEIANQGTTVKTGNLGGERSAFSVLEIIGIDR